MGRLGLELAAVAIGTARGAMDDLVAIGTTKRPLGGLGKPLSQDAVFQHTLGRLDLELRIAGTLLEDLARRDWQRVTAGQVLDQRTMLERRTLIARIGEMAVAVVDGAYHAGGTTGLFESHPLQRRLRDIYAVAQHVTFTSNALTPVGGLLLGERFKTYSSNRSSPCPEPQPLMPYPRARPTRADIRHSGRVGGFSISRVSS